MKKDNSQQKMIQEEQRILEDLIHRMDAEIKNKTELLEKFIKESRESKGGNTDVGANYGITTSGKENAAKSLKNVIKSRDELYEHRIVVEENFDNMGPEIQEYKIGLRSYSEKGDFYVLSWKQPMCRHYLMADPDTEFVHVSEERHGKKTITTYNLKLKRKVDLRFTKVRNVVHLFPLTSDEAEQIVADEFLQELLERRSNPEFQNIVFSIQKQQGEIIQAPFRTNMIVQGCAGSGKSMIMLHRLPILIYDNPKFLSRSNMYIITPSQIYIQMAQNMLNQLEISDLKMGTLKQYYDYCIEKYNRSNIDYGKYDPLMTAEDEAYVYSEECLSDIGKAFEELIYKPKLDLAKGRILFGLQEEESKGNTFYDKALSYDYELQKIVNENRNVLRAYHAQLQNTKEKLERLSVGLRNRKGRVEQAIRKQLDQERRTYNEAVSEKAKLNPLLNRIAIRNKNKIIKESQERTARLDQQMVAVQENNAYFERLTEINKKLGEVIKTLDKVSVRFEETELESMYAAIANIPMLIEQYYYVYYDLDELEDEYIELIGTIKDQVEITTKGIEELEAFKSPYLHKAYYESLVKKQQSFKNVASEFPQLVYKAMMKKIIGPESKMQKSEAGPFSPYLYLQILYQFRGVPNASMETLITIDEAQGLAKEELQLIKNVNGGTVVFNLFGDEKQHIEGTKGVDSWDEITHLASFDVHDMIDNYRNARQITNYCNERFGMNMRAINLDGAGVFELQTYEDFTQELIRQFGITKQGSCAIVVKDVREAEYLKQEYHQYRSKLHDLTGEDFEPHYTKWNLLTVEEAKGLEFASVIAITGRMTQNEKYISYTRALDELIVYDVPLEENYLLKYKKIEEENTVKEDTSEARPDLMNENIILSIKQFFSRRNIQVVDWSSKTGEIWVIGGKRQIGTHVDEVCKMLSIQGEYSHSVATDMKPGWVVKLDKKKN